MTKYEYKFLKCKPVGFTETWFDGTETVGDGLSSEMLTKYGLEGWEAVSVTNSVGGHTSGVILKRPVTA